MSTNRGSSRVSRRRKSALNLDLNSAPPGDNRDHEGSSSQVNTRNQRARRQGSTEIPAATIDVEAIDDDDVMESSRMAFVAAKNNRRNRARIVVDVESEEYHVGANNHPKRRRVTQNHNAVNIDSCIILESCGNSKKDPVVQSPPKELTFNCPICMCSMVDEMSTKCGHIFCKACIKAVISSQGKCPTCRKRVTAKDLIRVFLPAATCL